MNELTHLATGVLTGRTCTGPVSAVLAGVAMHGLMDVAPHCEIRDRDFEIASIAVGLPLLALATGPASPVLWGAIGGVLPDLEHIVPARVRPKRPLFPTHRWMRTHSSDTPLAAPVWTQVAFGGAVIGWHVARGLYGRYRRRNAMR